MAAVMLIPMGNKIKFIVRGKILCNRLETPTYLQKSLTCTHNDQIWLDVFGSKRLVKKFLKKNRVVRVNIPIYKLGYDSCDHVV